MSKQSLIFLIAVSLLNISAKEAWSLETQNQFQHGFLQATMAHYYGWSFDKDFRKCVEIPEENSTKAIYDIGYNIAELEKDKETKQIEQYLTSVG